MARPPRLEFAGACYHVINRGNYRRDLFTGAGAAAAFERTLFEACPRFAWRLHAFVIMRNHFHLALKTTEPNLSAGMQWLQTTWVSRFNRFRGLQGRPFQGRFRALLVEPGEALGRVADYIHLNPLRAKAVAVEHMAGFRWSSLHHFLEGERPAFLEAGTVLRECGGLPDTKPGWQRYLQYLAFVVEENAREKQGKFERLSAGWCIGSETFRASLEGMALDACGRPIRSKFPGMEPSEWQKEREKRWEEDLVAAAKALQIDLGSLPEQGSAPAKVRLAGLLRVVSSASNGWLARRLGMGKPASVSQFVRRFRIAGGLAEPAFQRALSTVKA